MSLLTKASTVTTPTAYSEGFLHSVKPADSFGQELVTNGDFSTSSDWTFTGAGIAISGGKLNFAATTREAQQSISVVSGKKYRVSFEISNYVSGDIRIELGSSAGTLRNSNGVFVEFIEAAGTALIEIDAINTFTGSIDNVSVKEVLGADFTFSRASAATRVNEQGLIEKERGNTTTYSQDANNWSSVQATRDSSSESDPFGGTSAGEYTASGTSAGYVFASTSPSWSSGQVVTGSVYVRDIDSAYVQLTFGTATFGTGQYQNFDLSSGTKGTGAGMIDSIITSVGGGWYRLSITAQSTTSGSGGVIIVFVPSASSTRLLTPNAGQTLQIFGIQTELGLVATDYIETTTAAVYEGITDNIPRINYENGIGSFLLEPQRTNLVPYSEYYDASDWVKGNVSITSNATTSPEGVVNASKLIEDSSNSTHYIADTISTSSGVTHSLFVFAKKAENRYIRLSRAGGSVGVGFDLENGDFVAGGGAIGDTEDLGNGWYKCIMIFDTNVTSTQIRVELSSFLSAVNNTYLGNGTSGVYIYGAQLEASSYATSYIPTYGSSVTFASESCNNAGNSSLFNDSEGVLYAEMAALANDGTNRRISLSDGTTNNRIVFSYSSTSNQFQTFLANPSVQFNFYHTLSDSTDFNKIAVKYKLNDFALWINGVEVATDVSGTLPVGLYRINFDEGSGASDFYGKTKMVATFKQALSDSELECLTSWSSFNRMATAQNYTIE
jgi:hypothetical protein